MPSTAQLPNRTLSRRCARVRNPSPPPDRELGGGCLGETGGRLRAAPPDNRKRKGKPGERERRGQLESGPIAGGKRRIYDRMGRDSADELVPGDGRRNRPEQGDPNRATDLLPDIEER